MVETVLPLGEAAAKMSTFKKRSRAENDWEDDDWVSFTRSKPRQKGLPLHKDGRTAVNDEEKIGEPEQNKSDSDGLKGWLQPVVDHRKKVSDIESSLNEYEKTLLEGLRYPDDLSTTFKDVHLPPATIESVRMLTTLSLLRPDAFTYGVLAANKILGVLLYGAPGTGKTHLAKAVAKESGATMLEVSGADVLQQNVGEGEKMVRAIFSLARKLDPCIVFFDEAEGVLRRRSDDDRGYQRELLNQFLREWDGIAKGKDGEGGGGFVMVATNRPCDLDEAVLRRLPRRILIDVPTAQDREAILKIYLGGETLGPDIDIPKIAEATTGYTGSDIKNMCVAAAFACMYEEIKAVTKAGQPGWPSVDLSLAKAKFPARRKLYARHFDKAMEEVSATISESSIDQINKFHHKRGWPKKERRIMTATATNRDYLPKAFSASGMDYFTKRVQEHMTPQTLQ